MKIAIYGILIEEIQIKYMQHLFNECEQLGVTYYINEKLFEQLVPHFKEIKKTQTYKSTEDLSALHCDYMVTCGGDGTFLEAATFIRNSSIPMIGINLGRLGFLARVDKKQIPNALEHLLHKNFELESRSLLQLSSNHNLFGDFPFALNEVTIIKRDNSSMVVVHAFVNDEYLNSYWADGIIISTPTGSTGYNLSCGGPILMPESSNFVLTPIAPHNLFVRPLVIPDHQKLSFKIEGRADFYLCTCDSRHEKVTNQTKIQVSLADFKLLLIKLPNQSFLHTMSNKLGWGKDLRNKPKKWN